MEDRKKKTDDVWEQIEVNIELLGVTAIEDKLQDQVGSSYCSLHITEDHRSL